MSETPWTPGPWEWQGYHLRGSDGVIVRVDWLGERDRKLGRCDARLIEAAPEMAELLERLIRTVNQDTGTTADYDDIDRAGEEAEALLARIRGTDA